MATLDQARAAQHQLLERLAAETVVNGIGITRVGDDYGVKVNLRERSAQLDIPASVGGVQVTVEVVGRIVPH
ncbi:MAG: hypothetical protein WBP81_11085 [Solirubrobacteraceae bacterium]